LLSNVAISLFSINYALMKVNNGYVSVRLAGGENNLLPQIFAMQIYFEPCWIKPCLLFSEHVLISKFLLSIPTSDV